jgi:hypothetical protein
MQKDFDGWNQQKKSIHDASHAPLARKSLVSTHRPRLRVRNIVVEYPDPAELNPIMLFIRGKYVRGKFEVTNIGGTLAKVQKSHCQVFWTRDGLPMEPPNKEKENPALLEGQFITAGMSYEGRFVSDEPMDGDGLGLSAFAKDISLYVMGWITYTDDSDDIRRTAFCRVYRQVEGGRIGRFRRVDDDDYEHEE